MDSRHLSRPAFGGRGCRSQGNTQVIHGPDSSGMTKSWQVDARADVRDQRRINKRLLGFSRFEAHPCCPLHQCAVTRESKFIHCHALLAADGLFATAESRSNLAAGMPQDE